MSRKMLAAIRTAPSGFAAAQPVEVEDRERAEDHESGDGVDDVAVGDRDEDRDDPERDQGQQRPEQRAGPRREIAARRVAVRAERGDERCGGACRLPQRGRVGLGVVGDDGGDREPEQSPSPNRRPIASCSRPLGGGAVESEDHGEGADEQPSPVAPLRSRPR